MGDSTCISIKSKKEPHIKCNCPVIHNNLCGRHLKQRNVKIWNNNDENNPLMSSNDIDPISLDVIWVIKNKTRVLADLKIHDIFTYSTQINNHTFIRSLSLKTINQLIKNYNIPRCPFSNLPLSNDTLNKAKLQILSSKPKKHKYTKNEKYKINLSKMIDKFQECGYPDVQLKWLYDMSTNDIIKWSYELDTIFINFKHDHPHLCTCDMDKYINKHERDCHKIVNNLYNLCNLHMMGVQIVISALAWSNYQVQNVYPSLQR